MTPSITSNRSSWAGWRCGPATAPPGTASSSPTASSAVCSATRAYSPVPGLCMTVPAGNRSRSSDEDSSGAVMRRCSHADKDEWGGRSVLASSVPAPPSLSAARGRCARGLDIWPGSVRQERRDHGPGQRLVDELADPALVVGAVGVARRREPAPAPLDEYVRELRDRHREVRRVLDPPRSARLRICGADEAGPPRLRAVLDEHHGELLGRVGEAGVVEVEDAETAIVCAPDVVGPEIAVARPELARRSAEVRLKGDELREQRVELVGERSAAAAERLDQLRPPRRPDRLGVPRVDADRAGEVDTVQAGDELPDSHRIEVPI